LAEPLKLAHCMRAEESFKLIVSTEKFSDAFIMNQPLRWLQYLCSCLCYFFAF